MKELSGLRTHSWEVLSFSYNQYHTQRYKFILRMVRPSIKIWRNTRKTKFNYCTCSVYIWITFSSEWLSYIRSGVHFLVPFTGKWDLSGSRFLTGIVIIEFREIYYQICPFKSTSWVFSRLAILQEWENVAHFLVLKLGPHFIMALHWPFSFVLFVYVLYTA